MRTQICTSCKKELPRNEKYFSKYKHGTSRGYRMFAFSRRCLECREFHANFKKCGRCKKVFPKTLEYFPIRKEPQKKKDGTIVIYHLLKFQCIECSLKTHREIQKRIYYDDLEKSREIVRRKYWKNPEKRRAATQAWRERNPNKIKEHDKLRIDSISDSYICNHLGIPVSETPAELIEAKRLMIKIHREIKLNHEL